MVPVGFRERVDMEGLVTCPARTTGLAADLRAKEAAVDPRTLGFHTVSPCGALQDCYPVNC